MSEPLRLSQHHRRTSLRDSGVGIGVVMKCEVVKWVDRVCHDRGVSY